MNLIQFVDELNPCDPLSAVGMFVDRWRRYGLRGAIQKTLWWRKYHREESARLRASQAPRWPSKWTRS